MSSKPSDSENIVISEIFRNPNASLEEIAAKVEEKRKKGHHKKDDRFRKDDKVDIRSVAKYKSLGLKKIKKGLKELADAFRLDYSIQGRTKREREEDAKRSDILEKNGILIGYDFRDDRGVYIFYSTREQRYLPWQDHICTENCREQCFNILNLIREERGLDKPAEGKMRDLFEKMIDEIVERIKD